MWNWVLLLLFASLVISKPELISVAIITNTGSRNIMYPEFYFIDKDEKARGNYSELTKMGKRQHYLLGHEIANRYKDLITDPYPPSKVFVSCSGANATYESAQAFLLGLFPPGTGSLLINNRRDEIKPPISVKDLKKIQDELGYVALPHIQRIIPIHSTNTTDDTYYSPHLACKGFENEEESLKDELDDLNIKYKDFLKKFADDDPRMQEFDLTTEHCYKIQDTLQALKWNGFNATTFRSVKPETLEECALADVFKRFLGGSIRIKLMTYYLLSTMRHQFEQVMNNTKDAKNMSLFFLTDLHILAVFKLFDWHTNKVVPFAGQLIFELYRDEDEKEEEMFIMKAKYNETELKFTRTSEYASEIFTFIERNTFISRTEFEQACRQPIHKDYDEEFYVSISILLWLFLIGLWGVSWFIVLSEDKPIIEPEEAIINY